MSINNIVENLMKACGYKSEASLARSLGMSPQNFNSRKNSGGIKDTLILHAIERGVNMTWLLTSQGEMLASAPASQPLSKSSPQSVHINSILEKVAYVIEHGDERAKLALEFGVEGVYGRVKKQEELMEALVEQQKEQGKDIKELGKDIKELVSLLKGDLEKEEMVSESLKVNHNQQS